MSRNTASESAAEKSFRSLQDRIFSSFGAVEPKTPVLWCRNATQTSVVLEWEPIQLATADLLSLALYRNNQKAGNIPKPTAMHSTKISGLAVDTEYTFHLVLRTTAGTFSSERLVVRTHKMTDLSGITITTGILPPATREGLGRAVERIGAKIVDGVRIDTTHFVTTEGRGVQWEKASEMNIPVVRPEWVDACEKTGRILGVTKFYLDAVRPPPGDEAAASGASSAPTPASVASPRPQKDLPLPPAADGADGGPSSGAGSSGEDGPRRKEEAVGGDEQQEEDSEEEEEEEEEEEGVEEKTRSGGQDEQKMRVEERDEQNLPSRPKPTVEDDDEEDDEDEAEDGREAGAAGSKEGKSPGDGSSFQDVAL